MTMTAEQAITQFWNQLGSRWLPFADAASERLPLSRLLRLSAFQLSVGMAMVLLNGTLNRVMIVELGVAAALVAFMVSLPLLFAPLRALYQGGCSSSQPSCLRGWGGLRGRSSGGILKPVVSRKRGVRESGMKPALQRGLVVIM